jgi:hypothetical protein
MEKKTRTQIRMKSESRYQSFIENFSSCQDKINFGFINIYDDVSYILITFKRFDFILYFNIIDFLDKENIKYFIGNDDNNYIAFDIARDKNEKTELTEENKNNIILLEKELLDLKQMKEHLNKKFKDVISKYPNRLKQIILEMGLNEHNIILNKMKVNRWS